MKKQILLWLLLLCLLMGCAGPAAVPAGSQGAASTASTAPTVSTADSGAELTVHFIDVGQADCTLFLSGGEAMLIDGGNVADSRLVVSYLQAQGVEALDYVVCTHAHEDHVGGLPGVLAVFPTRQVFSPTRTYASQCFDDFMYYCGQQDLTPELPEPGTTFSLGGCTVEVLGPVKTYADTNNTSICLKVLCGEVSFLFTGDAELEAETDMLDAGADVSATVLQVGHHGSSTSTGYRFLYEAAPRYAVISCGAGNSYGHPHEEVLSRLRDAGVTLYRTDLAGTIVAQTDGKTVTFSVEGESPAPTAPGGTAADWTEAPETTGATGQYIGNRRSEVFHLPSCSSLPKEENRVYFDTYDEAVEAGMTPCSRCLP